MAVNCIIIEDEPLAREKLEDFINKTDFLKLVNTTSNGIDAIGFIQENPVDVIFLDIRMKKFSGIQFLEAVQNRPKVIITTAYDQYALKSYDYDVCDYLLKPFSFERFLKAVNKAVNEMSLENKTDNNSSENIEYIFIKTENRIEKIFLKDILYVEGLKDYLKIVLGSSKILTLLSFNKLLEILPEKQFIRVHKSYVISIDKIQNIERNRIKIDTKLIPISDTYRKEFYAHLKDKNLLK